LSGPRIELFQEMKLKGNNCIRNNE